MDATSDEFRWAAVGFEGGAGGRGNGGGRCLLDGDDGDEKTMGMRTTVRGWRERDKVEGEKAVERVHRTRGVREGLHVHRK